MAAPVTRPQTRPAQTQTLEQDPKSLLDSILASMDEKASAQFLDNAISQRKGGKSSFLDDAIERRIPKIKELLPVQLKDQAERLARRAMMYFKSNPVLENCPASEFVKCVLQAAELGLTLDGRLCWVVNHKGRWVVYPSYKGLIAVARRSKLIEDVELDIIGEYDEYHCRHTASGTDFLFERNLTAGRGETIGAYCKLIFPSGRSRIIVMDRMELDAIKERTNSKKNGQIVGPWATDEAEMQKKTVCKRALKTYEEDSSIAMALSLDDQVWEDDGEPAPPRSTTPPVGRHNLRRNGHAATPEPDPQVQPPAVEDNQAALSDVQACIDDLIQLIELAETGQQISEAYAAIAREEGLIGMMAATQLRDRLNAKKG